jgi:glycosyltransferase involved in cell wall biosynthesis
MSRARPLFSIVMPTRNRAHLLLYALQSALAQTCDDFEIVVSNNASSDGTADVAQSTGDPRVRYVATDRSLPMPAHWEFALGHARGEFVTFLSDDDAMIPGLLSRLQDLFSEYDTTSVYWSAGFYYHDTWYEPKRRGQLWIGPFSGEVREVAAHAILTDLYQLHHAERPFPRMLNSCCSWEVIERVKARAGRFFIEPCPDFGATAVMAAAADCFLYVDAPWMLAGCGRESIGASQYRRMNNATTNTFWEEFRNGHEIAWQVPLRQGSVPNAVADTILRCRAEYGGRLAYYHLDWVGYFTQCWQQIQQERRFGGDTAPYVEEWRQALTLQPPSVQSDVRRNIRPKDWWERTHDLTRRAGLRVVRTVTGRGQWRVADRRTLGFSNIAEAAATVEREYLSARAGSSIEAACPA